MSGTWRVDSNLSKGKHNVETLTKLNIYRDQQMAVACVSTGGF